MPLFSIWWPPTLSFSRFHVFDPILENLGDRYLDLPYQQQTQASPLLLQRLFNHTHRTPTFSGIHSKKKERKDLRLKDWKKKNTVYLQKENKEDQEHFQARRREAEFTVFEGSRSLTGFFSYSERRWRRMNKRSISLWQGNPVNSEFLTRFSSGNSGSGKSYLLWPQ